MEISSIIIGLILLGGSVAYISLPFRQRRRKDTNSSKAPIQQEGQREVVLVALRDLDFDFKTGKVSQEDYKPLRAQLMVEAAQYMEIEKKGDDQLEQMIRALRAGKQEGARCQHCEAPIRAGDLFCSSCGKRIEIHMGAVAQS